MTGITWGRVEALMAANALVIDATAAPVTPVGGTSPDALPIAGLVEAQAIRDAFAGVGWTVNDGHEWSLTAGFNCDGVPTSICISFDRVAGRVRSWVSAAAAVRANDGQAATDSERGLLGAVFEFAETPFPSMSGMIRLGRGLAYPDVPEEYWPTPFVQAAADWHVLVPGAGGLRTEPFDPPVRTLVVGYHWGWIPDEAARATVITHAVDHLPTVLVAVRDLYVQDPSRFTTFMGTSIPSLQLGARLAELRATRDSVPRPLQSASPTASTLSSSGNKIGQPTSSISDSDLTTAKTSPSPVARYCGQCGTARSGGARFCGQCGAPFAASPTDGNDAIKEPEIIEGDDPPLDSSAREILERSAVQGDSLAMLMLSHDAKKLGDDMGARKWLEMSALAGNSEAMALLAARSLEEGDWEATGYWMQQAAEAGNILAMAWMGAQAVQEENWVEARAWLEPAAAAGQVNAKISLGIVERVVGDSDRARELFTDAADQDEPEGLHQLALMLHDDGDTDGAVALWQAAADRGSGDSMHALGVVFWREGCIDVALPWFTKASGVGNVNAMRACALIAQQQGDLESHRSWLIRAAENGDAQSQNDLGSALVHEGRLEEGLALLEASSRQGVPWALASYSWALLKAGEYARAVSLADEVMSLCEQFVRDAADDAELAPFGLEQLANAKSNLALCRLALGGDYKAAESTWHEGAQTGHLESLFYPAVIARREDRQQAASAIANSLSAEQQREMRETLNELMEGGDAWLVAWCRDGLSILEGSSTAGAICAKCGAAPPVTARFCPECGTGLSD